MTWLLSKLMGYLLPGVAVLLGLSLVWGGVQSYRLKLSKAETADVQKLRTLEKAQATQVALESEQKQRAREQAWSFQVKEQQDAYVKLQADSAKKLAAFAAQSRADIADNGRLRDALATYASGSGSGGTDTAAAASQRAAALGLLLAEALRLEDETLLAGAESTGAAESTGDAVRAVLAAWPH